MSPIPIPAVFVTDFGPFPAVEDDEYTAALAELGRALPRPRAIIVMSGHWETRGALQATSAKKPGAIHDFSGFGEEFYRLDYPCPGDPPLAADAAKRLSEAGIPAMTHPERGLDHGAWVPLSRMYPKADIPVVQLSVPAEDDPARVMRAGQALAPLRAEGVLIAGAGALSHNLRLALAHAKNDPPDAWAERFDTWIAQRLDSGGVEELLEYRKLAPESRLAAPTPEHFNPIFFPLGAAAGERPTHFYRGIRHANGIMRIFALGLEGGKHG